MPDDVSPEQVEQICAQIYAGRKIAAIKIYREVTGKGLKEAKEFVEGLTARLHEETPEKFTAPQGQGCSAVLALLAVAAVAARFLLR